MNIYYIHGRLNNLVRIKQKFGLFDLKKLLQLVLYMYYTTVYIEWATQNSPPGYLALFIGF